MAELKPPNNRPVWMGSSQFFRAVLSHQADSALSTELDLYDGQPVEGWKILILGDDGNVDGYCRRGDPKESFTGMRRPASRK